jgi:ATP-dependent phosphoenolpyruvate carboxykinase
LGVQRKAKPANDCCHSREYAAAEEETNFGNVTIERFGVDVLVVKSGWFGKSLQHRTRMSAMATAAKASAITR